MKHKNLFQCKKKKIKNVEHHGTLASLNHGQKLWCGCIYFFLLKKNLYTQTFAQ